MRKSLDENLRLFALKSGYVCNLENGGKMSDVEAYKEIKKLWKALKKSKKGLRVGEDEIEDEIEDESP